MLFLVVAFAWTWAFELAGRARQTGAHPIDGVGPWLVVASFGPTVAAFAAAASEGRVRDLVRRIGRFRQRWTTWLMACYLLVPAAVVAAIVWSNGDTESALAEAVLLVFVPVIGLFSILTGPLGEELGWRGVLLPRLLERRSPMVAALTVGSVWAVWHAPLWTFDDFIPGLGARVFVPLYVLSIVAFSVVMTLLHHRSSGSVAVAILAHGVFNSVVLPFEALHDDGVLTVATAWPFTVVVTVTAVVVAVTTRFRLGAPARTTR